jgi:hypothetical protein
MASPETILAWQSAPESMPARLAAGCKMTSPARLPALPPLPCTGSADMALMLVK